MGEVTLGRSPPSPPRSTQKHIVPMLRIRALRLREVRGVTRCHRAGAHSASRALILTWDTLLSKTILADPEGHPLAPVHVMPLGPPVTWKFPSVIFLRLQTA